MFGIKGEVSTGEYLTASYINLENKQMAEQFHSDKIAFRGPVVYCQAEKEKVLATLIPPFAPLEVVGAPPERASIPVKKTDIPLAVENSYGKGKTVYLPFSLSDLTKNYKLSDHFDFFECLFKRIYDKPVLQVKAPSAVLVNAYKADGRYIVHLVNETGERPLQESLPVANLELTARIPEGKTVSGVRTAIEEAECSWTQENGQVKICLGRLDVWQMLVISY